MGAVLIDKRVLTSVQRTIVDIEQIQCLTQQIRCPLYQLLGTLRLRQASVKYRLVIGLFLDLSRIDVTMPIRDTSDIPYYIPYCKKTGYENTEEALLIMVSVKGRKQRCYHCHSLDLWPNMTKNKKEQCTERTLGRRIEPAYSGVVAGVSYTRIAGERKAAIADL